MDRILMGLLWDFAGRLTTLEKGMVVGAKHTPHRIIDEVVKFAKDRDIYSENSEPYVEDWQIIKNFR